MIALPPLHREHGLAASVLVLAGLAAWPWLAAPTIPDRPRAPEQAPPAALAALPPLVTFAAIVDRPLFAASRRPDAAVSQATPAGLGIEARYRLLGLIGVGSERKALVTQGARRLEIGIGDVLDGWTVKEIGQDRVRLTSAAGEVSLKLSRAPAPETKPQ